MNGDGYSDVIVGADGYDNGQSEEGRVYIYLGRTRRGRFPARLDDLEGNQATAHFGWSVGTAGDVNGDGFSDVIVGAPAIRTVPAGRGGAFVYLGSAVGLATSPVWSVEGSQYAAHFGNSVGTAGDVNGDGYSDVIVGAYGYSNGETEEGRAFVYLGSASGPAASAVWIAEGNQEWAIFGWKVGTAGDVNGDGFSDIIVGTYAYDNGQADEGRAYVYLGSAGGPAASPSWTAESDQVNGLLGISVATAGDVNGDGYSDVIVGVAGYDNVETDEGRALLYLGSASGLAPSPASVIESNQAEARLGVSVATAGDVNGDGYADVIIGASGYDNGEAEEGRAFLYYGGGGPGLSLVPQQRRADGSRPVQALGSSRASDSFSLEMVTAQTPFGPARVRLEGEAKPLGASFNGTGTTMGDWHPTWDPNHHAKCQPSGLTAGTAYHWRARLLYDPATTPFQSRSRWISPWWNGPQETDLRTTAPDADGDGYTSPADCDDGDARVYPGAPQRCDGINNDCNDTGYPAVPANETDDDADGYVECSGWVGSVGGVVGGGDCNDADAAVHPGAAERCDGLDDDCNGATPASEYDHDGDHYVECTPWVGSGGGILGGGDCDDAHATVYPGAAEICDGLDNDCNGTRPLAEYDHDGDRYVECAPWVGSGGALLGGADCVDTNVAIYPGAPQLCDGVNDDCTDPSYPVVPADELDHDGDRFVECAPWIGGGGGGILGGADCLDTNATVYPGAPQLCDGLQNDCNAPAYPTVPLDELDHDGDRRVECASWVGGGGGGIVGGDDCNDADPSIYPGAPELCDYKDNDCNLVVDDGWITPGPVSALTLLGDRVTLEWAAEPSATRYDVVKGGLASLRSTGGDFTASLLACLEDDGTDLGASDPENPVPGSGFYYVVRAQRACRLGTYNTAAPSQAGDRDPEIEAAPPSCAGGSAP